MCSYVKSFFCSCRTIWSPYNSNLNIFNEVSLGEGQSYLCMYKQRAVHGFNIYFCSQSRFGIGCHSVTRSSVSPNFTLYFYTFESRKVQVCDPKWVTSVRWKRDRKTIWCKNKFSSCEAEVWNVSKNLKKYDVFLAFECHRIRGTVERSKHLTQFSTVAFRECFFSFGGVRGCTLKFGEYLIILDSAYG